MKQNLNTNAVFGIALVKLFTQKSYLRKTAGTSAQVVFTFLSRDTKRSIMNKNKISRKTRKQINRDGQHSRNAELNAKAHAAGWKSLSEYLTAVRKGAAMIPDKGIGCTCPLIDDNTMGINPDCNIHGCISADG